MSEFVEVAKLSEVPETEGLVIHLGKREIGLFRVDGRVQAIDNICPHRGGPLAEGQREGSVITCPWHAWSFDLTDGKCTFNEDIRVDCFEVKIDGDRVLLRVGGDASAP